MKEKAIRLRGVFNGLYEWGRGWTSDYAARQWDGFLEIGLGTEIRPLFWKYLRGDRFGGCGSLVTTGSAIYLHPMSFDTILVSSGCCCRGCKNGRQYESHFEGQVTELRKICEALAEACGGTFNLYASKEFDIESPNDIKEIKSAEDYIDNCATIL